MQKGSHIPTDEYMKMFAPIWSDIQGQRRRDHPAPYPVELAKRIVRMFSFKGDCVLDPFGGTGSTAVAAIELGRDSKTVDVEPAYVDAIIARLALCEGGRAVIETYRPSDVEAAKTAYA